MNNLFKILPVIFVIILIFSGIFFFKNRSINVERGIGRERFKEFYFTRSKTTNPPEFQRYRFFMDGDSPMFYHEKREGDKVFLTEEDITVHGELELTEGEWEEFWGYIGSGTVKNRSAGDASSGGSGPWLYLYWDGDGDKKQVFEFGEPGMELGFEEYCMELKERELTGRQ